MKRMRAGVGVPRPFVLGRPSPKEQAGGAYNGHVFGIGLGRTGTRSLTRSLNILGYYCVHQPDPKKMMNGDFESALFGYDAATDSSTAACFRRLAEAYPESKFILTVRDRGAWLRSCKRKFSVRPDAACGSKLRLRKLLYGNETFDEETMAR